jgi:predicted ATPase
MARLVAKASTRTQVWVVSHASRIIAALKQAKNCTAVTLTRELGETAIEGQGMLDGPPWKWPER